MPMEMPPPPSHSKNQLEKNHHATNSTSSLLIITTTFSFAINPLLPFLEKLYQGTFLIWKHIRDRYYLRHCTIYNCSPST
mmetsp:Transcript_9629/g.14803  ORF Transcript_9629/g.14803 Transcript_9629/m.14803 type:complete len:80 (+) Transcript_9629:885-1124(+)